MKTPKPPVLQVLFEPFPDHADYRWDREGGEAFAGNYWLDALDPDGSLKVRGYRVHFEGCSGCRRADDDPRAHWDMRNDDPGAFAPKKPRRCGKWALVEKIVKSFGGWKRVHYVELAEYEGLSWQPIPHRRYVIEKCPVCEGTGYGGYIDGTEGFADCAAGCGSYTYQGRGEVKAVYQGPVRPDRHAMTGAQRRVR
jgi:hypothetical protein